MWCYFMNDFCVDLNETYWSLFYFYCIIVVWFWNLGTTGLIKWVWQPSFLFCIWKNLCSIGNISPLCIWQDSTLKLSVPVVFLREYFKIKTSLSSVYAGLFKFPHNCIQLVACLGWWICYNLMRLWPLLRCLQVLHSLFMWSVILGFFTAWWPQGFNGMTAKALKFFDVWNQKSNNLILVHSIRETHFTRSNQM